MGYALPLTVLLIAMAIPTGVAEAQFENGNTLFERCSVAEGDALFYQQRAACRSYILGALDDFSLEMEIAHKPRCVPQNATAGQITDVVVKYLRDNPNMRQLSGSVLVRAAMVNGFGCNLDRSK